jgi:CRISPR-associated endonuclease/helicase Cas3
MRTLVEQTHDCVKEWLEKLSPLLRDESEHRAKVGLHVLMGGEEDGAWDLYPEREAILIGTQDMLLSRALNRGYAAGRARWPKDFALLNNDCLWVFDEVQLMSTGFATSLQLQAWREREDMLPAAPVHSWWMSATVEKEWLTTSVDFRSRIDSIWMGAFDNSEKLWEEDRKGDTPPAKRLKFLLEPGTKTLDPTAQAELKVADGDAKTAEYIRKIAAKISEQLEKSKWPVLVIFNTVARACALSDSLEKSLNSCRPFLLHSRFRPRERADWPARLQSERLIIATQVVEAGVDISARILFTELCPWPSFIQRCGRAARYPGETADVFWLDVYKSPQPYSEDEMVAAKEELGKLKDDVSLAAFRSHRASLKPDQVHRLLRYEPRFVPQSKDLLELFDTTPDLTGADIDLSRFIRDGEEHDIRVFWRDCTDMKSGKNPPKASRWQPEHAELCPVPVANFRSFAKETRYRIWRWDYRDGWNHLRAGDAECIFPGQVFLLEKSCGGYHSLKGWTGKLEDSDFEIGPWEPALPQGEQGSDYDAPGTEENLESSDGASVCKQWRDILTHSREVCEDIARLIDGETTLPVGDIIPVLFLAGRLHDWGKAHAAFKGKVKADELSKAALADGLPAKAPGRCWRQDKLKPQAADTAETDRDYRRPGFRHELASALAIMELLRWHQPAHPALEWPDAELRAAFPDSEGPPTEPLPESAKPLAEEIADLSTEQFNLLLYLVAAHHGKVRLSLRSSPDDQREDVPQPCPPDKRQARGVRDDDDLPPVTLPGKYYEKDRVHGPPLKLHLDVMELGLSHSYGPSWRERTGALLQQHGPFRLAWYEVLLRIADQRASIRAQARASMPLA